MEIEQSNFYTKHGCNIRGKLAIINYQKEWKKHPQYEQFGGMTIYDTLDKAKALLFETYPNAQIELTVPDLVAQI